MFLALTDGPRTAALVELIDRSLDADSRALLDEDAEPPRRGPRRPGRGRGALLRRPCRGVGQHPLAPRPRKRGRKGDCRRAWGQETEPARHPARYRHRHRADDRIARPRRRPGARRRSLVGNAARRPGQARQGRDRRRQPAPGRHVRPAVGAKAAPTASSSTRCFTTPSRPPRRLPRRRACFARTAACWWSISRRTIARISDRPTPTCGSASRTRRSPDGLRRPGWTSI